VFVITDVVNVLNLRPVAVGMQFAQRRAELSNPQM
jgi:hypothetical protein